MPRGLASVLSLGCCSELKLWSAGSDVYACEACVVWWVKNAAGNAFQGLLQSLIVIDSVLEIKVQHV